MTGRNPGLRADQGSDRLAVLLCTFLCPLYVFKS